MCALENSDCEKQKWRTRSEARRKRENWKLFQTRAPCESNNERSWVSYTRGTWAPVPAAVRSFHTKTNSDVIFHRFVFILKIDESRVRRPRQPLRSTSCIIKWSTPVREIRDVIRFVWFQLLQNILPGTIASELNMFPNIPYTLHIHTYISLQFRQRHHAKPEVVLFYFSSVCWLPVQCVNIENSWVNEYQNNLDAPTGSMASGQYYFRCWIWIGCLLIVFFFVFRVCIVYVTVVRVRHGPAALKLRSPAVSHEYARMTTINQAVSAFASFTWHSGTLAGTRVCRRVSMWLHRGIDVSRGYIVTTRYDVARKSFAAPRVVARRRLS